MHELLTVGSHNAQRKYNQYHVISQLVCQLLVQCTCTDESSTNFELIIA